VLPAVPPAPSADDPELQAITKETVTKAIETPSTDVFMITVWINGSLCNEGKRTFLKGYRAAPGSVFSMSESITLAQMLRRSVFARGLACGCFVGGAAKRQELRGARKRVFSTGREQHTRANPAPAVGRTGADYSD
jgi:hypothetical protein